MSNEFDFDFDTYDVDDAKEDGEILGNDGASWMRLKEGRNVVRLLPQRKGERLFRVYFQHFIERADGTKAGFACPKKTDGNGGECPACEHSNMLQASGSAAAQKMSKRYWARKSILVNVIDRAEPDKGPKILRLAKKVHKQIEAIMSGADAEGERIKLNHPTEGYDLAINRTGTGQFDTEYNVTLGRKPKPLGTKEQMKTWFEAQEDLSEHTKLLEPAKIHELVSGNESVEQEVADDVKQLPEGSSFEDDDFDDGIDDDF